MKLKRFLLSQRVENKDATSLVSELLMQIRCSFKEVFTDINHMISMAFACHLHGQRHFPKLLIVFMDSEPSFFNCRVSEAVKPNRRGRELCNHLWFHKGSGLKCSHRVSLGGNATLPMSLGCCCCGAEEEEEEEKMRQWTDFNPWMFISRMRCSVRSFVSEMQ